MLNTAAETKLSSPHNSCALFTFDVSGKFPSAISGSGSSWSHVGGGQDGRFFNDGDGLEPLQVAMSVDALVEVVRPRMRLSTCDSDLHVLGCSRGWCDLGQQEG